MTITNRYHIRKRYLIALSIIALLSTSMFFVMYSAIGTQESYSSIINIAGRQRMLSQRIAMQATEYATTASPVAAEIARNSLTQTVNEMKAAYRDLTHGNETRNIPAKIPPSVHALYFQGDYAVDYMLTDFFLHVDTLLNTPYTVLSTQSTPLQNILSLSHHKLLNSLNAIVFEYERLAREDSTELLYIEIAFLATTLIALILEILFIFRPLENVILRSQKRLQSSLALAEQAAVAKSHFMANMSHEIRTPMNGVMGMTELLSHTKLDEKQERYVSTIQTSSNKLLQIINDILDFSKLNAGETTITPTPFNFRSMLEDLVAEQAFAAKDKPISIFMHYQPDAPDHLISDSNHLRKVLINLVGNAIKFTKSGYVAVHVGGEIHDSIFHLRLSVKDTGIGVSEDMKASVFDKFSQEDTSATRNFQGTGLGLAIVKQTIEHMGGEVGVESKKGEGSEFWITLALALDESSEDTTDTRTKTFKGKRAIIVDTLTPRARALEAQLTHWGINCSRHSTIKAAAEAIAHTHYDFAILNHDTDGNEDTPPLTAIPGLETTSLITILPPSLKDQHKDSSDNSAHQIQLVEPYGQQLLIHAIHTALTTS